MYYICINNDTMYGTELNFEYNFTPLIIYRCPEQPEAYTFTLIM